MFHITTAASADALCQEGARQDRVGSFGGIQAGGFFYLAPDHASAEYWAHKFAPQAMTWVEVTLPAHAHIADEETTQAAGGRVVAWATERGHIVDGDFSPVFLATIGLQLETLGIIEEGAAVWHLVGLMLAEEGYDGMQTQSDSIAVMNWSILTPDVFHVLAVVAR